MALDESISLGDAGHRTDHDTLHKWYNAQGGTNAGIYNIKHSDYGATGDGTTDDTAAIQAAIDAAEAAGGGIVWVPQTSNPGTTFYSVTALTIDSDGVQLVGPSFTASEIKSTTGTVLTIGSCEDVLVKNLELTTTSAGNHCIDVTGAAVIRLRVEHCKLSSESNTSSAINASGSGWQMLECAFVDNVYSSWAGSVPIINWTGAINGGCNLNRISGGRIIGGARTETMILLECDRANYFYDNVIENINFEIPTKGCVRANGTKGLTIRNCGVYDLVTATDDMIQLGEDGASGLPSIDTLISNVRRTSSGAGTLDTFFDVKVTSTSCTGVIINSSAHPAGDTKYDLGSSTRFLVFGAHATDTISNASGCQVFYTDGGGQVRLGTKVGFYGTAPTTKPAVTGTRNDPTSAIADLLTDLAGLGLVTDSTTAGTKPTITGTRKDGAALASLLTELATLNIVTDSSTAGTEPTTAFGGITCKDVNDTLTITTINVKVQVTSFTANEDATDLVPDHTNDHITVTTAGTYLCTASVNLVSTGGSSYTGNLSVWKNNGATEFTNVHSTRDMSGGGGDTGSASLSGLIVCAANDTIELWVSNSTGTENVIVDAATLSLVRVGD